jgi:hypothetical protein
MIQELYYCKTCNVKVCTPCKSGWHKKHDLILQKVKEEAVICNWGSKQFLSDVYDYIESDVHLLAPSSACRLIEMSDDTLKIIKNHSILNENYESDQEDLSDSEEPYEVENTEESPSPRASEKGFRKIQIQHSFEEEESEEDDEGEEDVEATYESNLEPYLRFESNQSREHQEISELIIPTSRPSETPLSSNPGSSEEYEGGNKKANLKNLKSMRQRIIERQDQTKQYERMIEKYPISAFIRDLINVLNSDTYNSLKECEISRLEFFDPTLNRIVSMYEILILMAHGIWVPSLLALSYELTPQEYAMKIYDSPFDRHNEVDDIYEDDNHSVPTQRETLDELPEEGKLKDFDTTMAVMAIAVGDYENFIRHSKRFLKVLKVNEDAELSALKKALRAIALVHAETIFFEIDGISYMRDESKEIFKILFGSDYKKALSLHSLVGLENSQLLNILKAESSFTSYKLIANHRGQENFRNFWANYCGLSSDSTEWLIAMTLITFEDFENLQFIADQYNLSDYATKIILGIWSRDILDMDVVFKALEKEIPLNLSRSISQIYEGEISAVKYFIPAK